MPPKRPLLSNYPQLRALLQANPKANAEFNTILSSTIGTDTSSDELNQALEALRASESNLQQQLNRAAAAEDALAKSVRFIKILGELLEAQTNFSPYTEDLAEKRKYQIEFSPAQIRMALRWYWDVLGSAMENSLLRTTALDPALERENDDNSS